MCWVGSGRMVLRKLRFASSRFSAGDETESASVLCERPDRPRVKSEGRAAMAGLEMFAVEETKQTARRTPYRYGV